MKLYIDTETCGLHSIVVLIQYAYEDGEVHLYDVWFKPVGETLELIEEFCKHTVIGFNLVFDWFHLQKLHAIWSLLPRDIIPYYHVDSVARKEDEARDGQVIKPDSCLDLMLHSRKGPYQSLMSREDVRVKRVPTSLAYALADELEERIDIDSIYFARAQDQTAKRWKVYDIDGRDDLKDVCLKFKPAGGLKHLAKHAIGYEPKFAYSDIEPPRQWLPVEHGWAPTASAISSQEVGWSVTDGRRERFAWPGVIQLFADFWRENKHARSYAHDDIVITRKLEAHFDFPNHSDDDSILACMVASVRWHGFAIDTVGLQKLVDDAEDIVAGSPINVNATAQVKAYIGEMCDESEFVAIEKSASKPIVKKMCSWTVDEEGEDCGKCFERLDKSDCLRCGGSGTMLPANETTRDGGNHPAAIRAAQILKVKGAVKEIQLYRKLIHAGRFHPAFTVVGTKSNRMSGAGSDGLNPQGINSRKETRRCFPLAWDGYVLSGGDFDGFEVVLAESVYGCEKLREDLLSFTKCVSCDGQGCPKCDNFGDAPTKIHGLFGQSLFPGKTYQDILASDGTDNDLYVKSKSGVFALLYGGDASTLSKNLSIDKSTAEQAYQRFVEKYPGVGKSRDKTRDRFLTIKQAGGVGTAVSYSAPDRSITSFLGFSRYFDLENEVAKHLFALASKPPEKLRGNPAQIVFRRSGRQQTASGALASALYGAAFGIQSAVMRAAANHEIQSPGGQITKRLQRRIWDLQPSGVHDFVVAPMNIHDEIDVVVHPDYVKQVTQVVVDTVESYRNVVPLIAITWNEQMTNWAEKKSGSQPVKVQPPELRRGKRVEV